MDVWGLASAFSDAVKKTGQDFVDTVRNTEWENELADIKKEIEEDTSEITENAKTLTEKINQETAKVVERTGLKQKTGIWEHDGQRDPSKKKPWISESTDAKFHEIGKKIFQSTGQTYNALSKAFQNELGLGSNEIEVPGSVDNHRYSRLEYSIEALERSRDTYELDPDDHMAFESWKKEAHSVPAPRVLSAMLEDSGALQEMYNLLVPEKVTEEEFWNRYLFKLRVLEKHQLRLAQATMRSGNVESNEVDWDDTWDEPGDDEDSQTGKEFSPLDSDAIDQIRSTDVDLHKETSNSSFGSDAVTRPDPAGSERDPPGDEKDTDTVDQSLVEEKEHDCAEGSAADALQPPVDDDSGECKDEALSESSFDDVTEWE